jgi:hypothetical protein
VGRSPTCLMNEGATIGSWRAFFVMFKRPATGERSQTSPAGFQGLGQASIIEMSWASRTNSLSMCRSSSHSHARMPCLHDG